MALSKDRGRRWRLSGYHIASIMERHSFGLTSESQIFTLSLKKPRGKSCFPASSARFSYRSFPPIQPREYRSTNRFRTKASVSYVTPVVPQSRSNVPADNSGTPPPPLKRSATFSIPDTFPVPASVSRVGSRDFRLWYSPAYPT